MIIGVDLDNTIISYDNILHSLALNKEYISYNTKKEKRSIRDATRKLPQGEIKWQRLQAAIYGPKINEADLIDALKNHEIAGAGLDVFEFEPEMVKGLSKLPNVVICPHIASATIDSRTNMALMAARNLLAMLKGEKPPQCINPEIFD